jgi:hypothetical protein
MDFCNYNININYLINEFFLPNITYIISFSIILIFVSFILFIVCSYFILKFLKTSIDNNNIFFYQYNKKSQKILDSYGDHEITKLYLVRQPFSKFVTFLLNIITLYNYEKLISESHENFPYHVLLVFEIKLPNNMKKLLLLEKTNYINICENFLINNLQDIKTIKLKNKNYTINSILKTTQTRVGIEKFFNWHIYKNNCQEFTKEILITLDKYCKTNKKYIFRDKLFMKGFPSEFTLHIVNCLCILHNIAEKYIYDSNILN